MELIIDARLADILKTSTRELNQTFRRNSFGLDEKQFRIRAQGRPRYENTQNRYLPYYYTFKGASLLISRLRKLFTEEIKEKILSHFQEGEFIIYDSGIGRFEPMTARKLKTILDGIVEVEEGYRVVIDNEEFIIDMYIPDCAIGIEMDEDGHKFYKNDELRQQKIQNRLGCKFIRIKEDDNIDKKLNEILKYIYN